LGSLYEKFYQKDDFKPVREILDCDADDSPEIRRLISEEPPEFTDYLNFFEFVAVLGKSRQLKPDEIEDLFRYYLDCLEKNRKVRDYIATKRIRALGQTAPRPANRMKDYLFGYGTLAAENAPREIAGTVKKLKCLGEGFIFGRLYDLGEYPAAVLDSSPRSKIFGKIYELPDDPRLLDRLDAYEEFDSEHPARSLFVRRQASINRPNKQKVKGWVYEYNGDVRSLPRIRNGRDSKMAAWIR
jgi:gamma-glutamylcyclotransferase (GGCT)/AIG2-like uncharacterized protein YtfP